MRIAIDRIILSDEHTSTCSYTYGLIVDGDKDAVLDLVEGLLSRFAETVQEGINREELPQPDLGSNSPDDSTE